MESEKQFFWITRRIVHSVMSVMAGQVMPRFFREWHAITATVIFFIGNILRNYAVCKVMTEPSLIWRPGISEQGGTDAEVPEAITAGEMRQW